MGEQDDVIPCACGRRHQPGSKRARRHASLGHADPETSAAAWVAPISSSVRGELLCGAMDEMPGTMPDTQPEEWAVEHL